MQKDIENTKQIEFYENLACLMYAIAIADGKIMIKEKREIVKIIEQEWLLNSPDKNNLETFYSTLKTLVVSHTDKEIVFMKFKDFYIENKHLFSDYIKSKIMKSVDSVAMAFANKNKSEVIMLSRIYLLLKS